ncbi:MAG: DDE-type integrase/transposase/recombinase [Fibrobacterota bacterium]|nr:DDE-type integrase/transposase/recombinase [Fibrobacterota bacterium]
MKQKYQNRQEIVHRHSQPVKEGGVHRNNEVRRAKNAKRPELVVTAPGQVWCWDIAWLDAPLKGTYFYLYIAIDMFSRKVVAWEVFSKVDGACSRRSRAVFHSRNTSKIFNP